MHFNCNKRFRVDDMLLTILADRATTLFSQQCGDDLFVGVWHCIKARYYRVVDNVTTYQPNRSLHFALVSCALTPTLLVCSSSLSLSLTYTTDLNITYPLPFAFPCVIFLLKFRSENKWRYFNRNILHFRMCHISSHAHVPYCKQNKNTKWKIIINFAFTICVCVCVYTNENKLI